MKNIFNQQALKTVFVLLTSVLAGLLLVQLGWAQGSDLTLKTVAHNVTQTLGPLTKLITAGAYIAGVGFSIGAIMKFKQHKDNPTQIPVGTPIAMLFIAAALLFLPTILSVTGGTLFGDKGHVAGPSGIIFKFNQ